MLVLVSGATRYEREGEVGHLIIPKAWSLSDLALLRPGRWAIDNGAFSGFDEAAFIRTLERFGEAPGCLFVAVPDVIGDAAATRARWPFWARLIQGLRLPRAFVAQDGIAEHQVPWEEMTALFIGGTTDFKTGPVARSLCGIAKARGLWVHWGRVNGRKRYELAQKAGADSIDGTGFSLWPDTNIPKAARWHAEIQQQPELDL